MTQYQRAENRMTPEQFSQALNQLGLTVREFCRIFGTGVKTVERWLADEKDIPGWVPVSLALMTMPGAPDLARSVAQHFSEVK